MGIRKIALVTGASRGIGLEISSKLSDIGYYVLGICRELDENILSEWHLHVGVDSKLFSVDITDAVAVDTFFANLIANKEMPSVLINNAGVTSDSFFHKMSFEQWENVIDINLKSLFFITQPVYRFMMEINFGRIINMSSVNANQGQLGQANYCATKAGVHGFTKTLALEGARSGITVNTISPGYTETLMTSGIRSDIKEKIISSIPMKRFATPSEIAAVVLYLISDDAGYTTGSNVSVNGGLCLI
jgi:acetoacetyl-CoA reductase